MELILPKEIYVLLFMLGDDLKITKTLRALCKLSLRASYEYFNSILKKDIILYDNNYGDLSINYEAPIRRTLGHVSLATKPISFKINIKDLFNSIEQSSNKNWKIRISPRYCG